MDTVVCVIDCRIDDGLENDYLALNVWGKPVFSYVTEECLESGCFSKTYIVTTSKYLIAMIADMFGERVIIMDGLPEDVGFDASGRYFIVSGRALMLKKETIKNALKLQSDGITLYSSTKRRKHGLYPEVLLADTVEEKIALFAVTSTLAMPCEEGRNYCLDPTEALVIHTRNDFELALVLKKKERNAELLRNMVQGRIKEKESIFRNGLENSICLLGHSQLDDWEVRKLCGMPVRNCGIRGISSFQYKDFILGGVRLARLQVRCLCHNAWHK